jgi:hypothetical protein
VVDHFSLLTDYCFSYKKANTIISSEFLLEMSMAHLQILYRSSVYCEAWFKEHSCSHRSYRNWAKSVPFLTYEHINQNCFFFK